MIRSAYDVDTEADRATSPSGSSRWGAPPPPPPPPPPPQQKAPSAAPSRREALFGLLGAGLGVGLTTAYFKTVDPELDEEVLEAAVAELLEDPEFMDAIADQVLFEQYKSDLDDGDLGEGQLKDDLAGK